MSLPGKNIKIFQITGKKPSLYDSTEFTLHKPITYLRQTTANKVFLANEFPFTNCKVGDHLGIVLDRTSLRFPNIEQGKIYKNSAVVAKVIKDKNVVPSHHKKVYNSEEFGDEWVEEE
ncbi:MAG: hypothetical protein I3273_02945 [Candidatus Moeniiplasma glomeromycotorum]|nr:hypothetical protein [Candidatus Moeniiplasma glomeromycotorum]MCE8167585.1 hypothetical protein [Candidatus Moeniiplasma glomeromycotorum]MCE8169063.1 hypothetical protein [Candidatus Moeniiplasma glomeromycotorum]